MIAPIFHHVVPKSQQEQHGAKEWETIFHSFFTHVFSMAARGASVRPGRFLPAVFFCGAGCGATQIKDLCWLVTPRTERTVRFLVEVDVSTVE
jgi:hypothetical protein